MKNQKPYWLIIPGIILIAVIAAVFKYPLYLAMWGIVKLDTLAIFIQQIDNAINIPFYFSMAAFSALWTFRGVVLVVKNDNGEIQDLNKTEKKQFINIIDRTSILFKFLLPWFIVIKLFAALLPTTKEAAVIIVVPTVVNYAVSTEEINRIPKSFFKLADSWLNELNPDNVKSTVKGATETVSAALGNVVDKTGDAVNSVVDNVKDKAIPTVKNTLSSVKNNTPEVNQTINNVTNTIDKVVDKIPNK